MLSRASGGAEYLAQVKLLIAGIQIGIQVEKIPEHEMEKGFNQSLYPRFLGLVKIASEVTPHIRACMIAGSQEESLTSYHISLRPQENLRWRTNTYI